MNKPKSQLTARQRELLQTIARYHNIHGISPSRQELADTLSVSTARVSGMISRLEDLGHVRRMPGMPRSLTVIEW